jgi:hypothetical protein
MSAPSAIWQRMDGGIVSQDRDDPGARLNDTLARPLFTNIEGLS